MLQTGTAEATGAHAGKGPTTGGLLSALGSTLPTSQKRRYGPTPPLFVPAHAVMARLCVCMMCAVQ